MANTPRTGNLTGAPAEKPDESKPAQAPQTPTEGTGASTSDLVASTPDDRDVAPVVDTQATEGRRFRAIPTHGGTTVGVTRDDFKQIGIDHDSVTFDFRKGNLTLKVGTEKGEISEEAAKALHAHEPTRFEFLGE